MTELDNRATLLTPFWYDTTLLWADLAVPLLVANMYSDKRIATPKSCILSKVYLKTNLKKKHFNYLKGKHFCRQSFWWNKFLQKFFPWIWLKITKFNSTKIAEIGSVAKICSAKFNFFLWFFVLFLRFSSCKVTTKKLDIKSWFCHIIE